MDDDSFTLKTVSSAATLESPPQGTEHFDSGYREIPGIQDHALSIGGSQIFPGTPGEFFSIHTGRVSAQLNNHRGREFSWHEEFWAYRDDAVHVLYGERVGARVPCSHTGSYQ